MRIFSLEIRGSTQTLKRILARVKLVSTNQDELIPSLFAKQDEPIPIVAGQDELFINQRSGIRIWWNGYFLSLSSARLLFEATWMDGWQSSVRSVTLPGAGLCCGCSRPFPGLGVVFPGLPSVPSQELGVAFPALSSSWGWALLPLAVVCPFPGPGVDVLGLCSSRGWAFPSWMPRHVLLWRPFS